MLETYWFCFWIVSVGFLSFVTPCVFRLGSNLFSFSIPPKNLTGGQWKTCAMSLAAWPVGPPIPFQLGLALGRVNVWCSTTVSSVVLIHHTIPYHTIPVLAQARPSKKQTGSFFFCKLGSISFHTPFHTRSIPVPCLSHAMWNSSPYLNHSENLRKSQFYI